MSPVNPPPDQRLVSITDDELRDELKRRGYVVLAERSHQRAIERHARRQNELEWEQRNTAAAELWAVNALREERRIRDRLTFVYGVARAHGATVDELGGRQDWTGPEIHQEVKALFDLYTMHGHGNWPDHYPRLWSLLEAPRRDATGDVG